MSTRQWSWKLGEFAGIGVYMHATFLLLLGWVAMVYWTQGGTLAAALAAAQVGKPFGHEALKVVDDLRAAKPPEPPIGFVQAALSGLRSKGRGRRQPAQKVGLIAIVLPRQDAEGRQNHRAGE